MGRRTSVWASASLMVAMMGASLAVPAAHAQEIRLSGGVDIRLASGTFGGNQTTTTVYAPAVLRLDVRRFEFAGSVPFLSVDNATGALSGGGWVPMQGAVSGAPSVGMPMTGRTLGGGIMGGPMNSGAGPSSGAPSVPVAGAGHSSPSGLGDIVVSAGYRILDNLLAETQVVLSVRVKFPTASATQGLGTGRADAGGSATLRKRFDSGWLYGELGYVILGKPVGTDLRNAVTWSAGGGKRIMSRVFFLGSAFGNSAVLSGYDSPAEIGAGLGFRLADHLNLTAIPSAGLSRASPKYGLTIGLSTDLWRR